MINSVPFSNNTKMILKRKSKSKILKCLNFCRMETALYNEKHTKTVLESERLVINKKVNDLKSDNG